jgi:hypothetical protein
MREKKNYKVITFHTTSAAMAMERCCEANGIGGRLIPVPREISAGCGLAWRMRPEEFLQMEIYLEKAPDDSQENPKIVEKAPGNSQENPVIATEDRTERRNNTKAHTCAGYLVIGGYEIEIEEIVSLLL